MLLNLLSPVMHNYLTPKPNIKTNIFAGSLMVIGVFWASLATYLYYISDMEKSMSAMITAGIFMFTGVVIYGISYLICRKIENKIVGTAMKEVMPIVNKVYDLANAPRLRMALPAIALAAGYMLFSKKH
jgi:hypothetical protein